MALLGLAFAAPVIEDTNTNSTVLGRDSYEFYYRFCKSLTFLHMFDHFDCHISVVELTITCRS
jgi:hypothetical protein